jgi:hypothetical protein
VMLFLFEILLFQYSSFGIFPVFLFSSYRYCVTIEAMSPRAFPLEIELP